jgi:hypothetical protein
MKTRSITILIILFSVICHTGFAANDDCPCRKKRPAPKKYSGVKTQSSKPAKSTSTDKKWDRYILYPNGFYFLPQGVDYSYGKMKEIQDYNVRIMPNPVTEFLNVIYIKKNRSVTTIELLTADGKLVQTLLQKNEPDGCSVHTFNIAGKVRPGIAYVRFTAGNMVKVEQIFIN